MIKRYYPTGDHWDNDVTKTHLRTYYYNNQGVQRTKVLNPKQVNGSVCVDENNFLHSETEDDFITETIGYNYSDVKVWYEHGYMHRESGPATIFFYKQGGEEHGYYWQGRKIFECDVGK